MKVGDYVRTRNGLIFKIIGGNVDNWKLDILYSTLEFFEDTWLDLYKYNDNGGWFITEHCKSSPNIIDLIEIGDILTIKDMLGNITKVEVDENFKLLSGKIVSIVTKKQFENIEYKIESEVN